MCDRSGQRIEKTWSRNKDEYDRMSGSNAGYVDGAVYGGIFSREIGSFAYGIAGDQRGRISWSRNHHCVRASGEGTDNCGKFMGMCMRWSCSGDRVSGWWSYHYGVCTDFPSRASTSGKIFFRRSKYLSVYVELETKWKLSDFLEKLQENQIQVDTMVVIKGKTEENTMRSAVDSAVTYCIQKYICGTIGRDSGC